MALSDNTTRIQNILDMVNALPEAGSGGSSIGKLTVDLTYNGSQNTWTATHTFDEIKAAISNDLIVEVSTTNVKLYLASHDNSYAIFSGTVCTDKCYSRTVTISSANVISYVEKILLTTEDSGEGVSY